MRFHYDKRADVLSLRPDDSKIEESQEVQPLIVLDFTPQNQVVAIEVLRFEERSPSADVKRLRFEIARAAAGRRLSSIQRGPSGRF